jgi:hypothetical protein
VDYLTALRQAVAERLAAREATQRSEPCIPPVIDQITKLLVRHPPATPLSLDALRAQLLGRYGRPPQRGEVAAALNLLGFTSVRIHRGGYDSRRYWLPTTKKGAP